ncbi:MAG: hypothetical protein ACRD0G_12880 [Acidimicrobiales bacterium]
MGYSALNPERRSQLLAAKLRALAAHLDLADGEPGTFPGGATLLAGGRGAFLGEDRPQRSLGPALAWARKHGVTDLHVLVPDAAGLLARRANEFELPPAIWRVDGRELHRVTPEPLPAAAVPPHDALALAPQLDAAGADVVVEHGVVRGEVLGLEIARVVAGDNGARIEAGVGRHDREAFAIIHGDLPTEAALAEVVGAARAHRRRDATASPRRGHPLWRLAAERWLREVVIAHPELVGADRLLRHEGPQPTPNVKEPWPAVAITDELCVVCSVGTDLDLVPYAADARLATDPDARLVLVVPERDAHPATRALAASLKQPAEVVTVPADWRSLVP